ncbi:MAG: 1,4-dihydroxy-2-naphthoate polyprenyltransferase [Actinobacteria bacterium]|jgi:1,4-dihydroxy-2-naphthoate octaprenyltransferase|nr:1,4-dihydroxy-2-naphthoate polyprenyltransferase [Actinomycetota bacterium]NDA45047.1 1,4-dihydroxy-2-naphthoate polyprenyltransferase [Actinomycetota bacterium]NDC17371.1 1,4-dihydroxy-2-naphthoate polyprenyltransferase [Actinomycetota bacterium]NDE39324.1 1,4-dihydroxy-2-naphthoate polyprenyltransferase [Actinomycetota bacterium]
MNKWILGARPRTLPAAIAPVFVATALAGSDWNWFRAALALKVGVWLQIGVNYANDYSDGVKGSDDNRIGPTRLVASGLATAAQVKRAAFISFGIASIAGIWLSLLSSPWLMVVGVAAIAAAWGYTGGKNPYGYSGLGEVSVFVFFGLTATIGTFYSQTGRITALSILCAVPMGALSCAILVVNNIRDRAQDELVGKRTLAVRVGDSKARKGFVALLAIAHISALATLLPSSLLTLAVLPLTISLSRAVLSGESGPSLIPLLGKTGKLQMFFGALFALALAIQ